MVQINQIPENLWGESSKDFLSSFLISHFFAESQSIRLRWKASGDDVNRKALRNDWNRFSQAGWRKNFPRNLFEKLRRLELRLNFKNSFCSLFSPEMKTFLVYFPPKKKKILRKSTEPRENPFSSETESTGNSFSLTFVSVTLIDNW